MEQHTIHVVDYTGFFSLQLGPTYEDKDVLSADSVGYDHAKQFAEDLAERYNLLSEFQDPAQFVQDAKDFSNRIEQLTLKIDMLEAQLRGAGIPFRTPKLNQEEQKVLEKVVSQPGFHMHASADMSPETVDALEKMLVLAYNHVEKEKPEVALTWQEALDQVARSYHYADWDNAVQRSGHRMVLEIYIPQAVAIFAKSNQIEYGRQKWEEGADAYLSQFLQKALETYAGKTCAHFHRLLIFIQHNRPPKPKFKP